MDKQRVIELAQEAGLEYNFDPMLWLKYEKFAELIAQECTMSDLKLLELAAKAVGVKGIGRVE